MKEFFKPTVFKIILFIIFLTLSIVISFRPLLGSWVYDGPIFNYKTIQCGEGIGNCSRQVYQPYVIFNLIFYYLLSCFVIKLINKVRKR